MKQANQDKEETIKLLKRLNPYQDVIGINSSMNVFAGYDEMLYQADNSSPDYCYDDDALEQWAAAQLSRKERQLLADEMISRWNKYRKQIG